LTGSLFVDLLRRMMRRRRKPLHLILDGLPAHKALAVKEFVAGLDGTLTLHDLPGSAPGLNPDEWVWSHATRTGQAHRPLQEGERLANRLTAPLVEMARRHALGCSCFSHPSVVDSAAY
jgi:transposase